MTPDHLATITLTLFGLVLSALTWEVRQLRREVKDLVSEDRCAERRKEHQVIVDAIKALDQANNHEHGDVWRALHGHKHESGTGDVILCPHTRK